MSRFSSSQEKAAVPFATYPRHSPKTNVSLKAENDFRTTRLLMSIRHLAVGQSANLW
jgi:hypothetical protein